MSKKLNRRHFIGNLTIASVGSFAFGACVNTNNDKDKIETNNSDELSFKTKLRENREMPRDLVMKLLDQKVNNYMQVSSNCAQSSFLALKEQFGLKSEGVLKALTPLTGIAERGETCGVVTGTLMAFGLIYGRDKTRLNDWKIYRESLKPSGNFCELFEDEFGSTMCHKIQNKKYGRSFVLTNPDELKEFQRADATTKCSEVVRKAVHIAADIILYDEIL